MSIYKFPIFLALQRNLRARETLYEFYVLPYGQQTHTDAICQIWRQMIDNCTCGRIFHFCSDFYSGSQTFGSRLCCAQSGISRLRDGGPHAELDDVLQLRSHARSGQGCAASVKSFIRALPARRAATISCPRAGFLSSTADCRELTPHRPRRLSCTAARLCSPRPAASAAM